MVELTKGNITSAMWKFSLPLLASVAFQQMYNISDSVIVGKFAGEDALAAVGASYPITMIFMAVAMGCNIGSSVIISQLYGSGKHTRMKSAVNTSLVMTMTISIILTIFGMLFSEGMLTLLGTPKNIEADGIAYLEIYTLGLPFLFLYNIASGIFTALGDSKTPLYLLIFSSIANVILDLVFVMPQLPFNWGVKGAAWATFLAQGVASVISAVVIFAKLKKISCHGKPKFFDSRLFSRIFSVTVPSVLQQSFVSVGNLFIQSLVNGYGSSVVAGYSAAIKLNTFGITSFSALGNAMSSFAAQNIGAKQIDRVKKGFKTGALMCVVVVAPFTIGYLFFSEFFLGLFLDADASVQAISVGKTFLQIVSPFYIVVAIKILCDGIIRGAGAMKLFMFATFTDLILRVVLSFVLSDAMGTSTGIWLSWPIGWTVASVVSLVFYFKDMWRKNL